MGLLKKYLYCTSVTACALKFTQTVGVDLHILPKVLFRTTATATRHSVMVTINEMDEWGC